MLERDMDSKTGTPHPKDTTCHVIPKRDLSNLCQKRCRHKQWRLYKQFVFQTLMIPSESAPCNPWQTLKHSWGDVSVAIPCIKVQERNRKYISYSWCVIWADICRTATDPLVHHGCHFGRVVHTFCNITALITSGLSQMDDVNPEPMEMIA